MNKAALARQGMKKTQAGHEELEESLKFRGAYSALLAELRTKERCPNIGVDLICIPRKLSMTLETLDDLCAWAHEMLD